MSTSPFILLPSSHARVHETFPAADELEQAFVRRFAARFASTASTALYATDASNYRHVPIGLVIPLDEEDVMATVAVCRSFGAPVLSRGGGTSLAGQCSNSAVILDFSKYMNKMGPVDPVRARSTCSPASCSTGCARLQRSSQLTFAPDPATH